MSSVNEESNAVDPTKVVTSAKFGCRIEEGFILSINPREKNSTGESKIPNYISNLKSPCKFSVRPGVLEILRLMRFSKWRTPHKTK